MVLIQNAGCGASVEVYAEFFNRDSMCQVLYDTKHTSMPQITIMALHFGDR
jgi:hypothetical protein